MMRDSTAPASYFCPALQPVNVYKQCLNKYTTQQSTIILTVVVRFQ